MDDFIHRLKEKNPNFLNILNNNHANEMSSHSKKHGNNNDLTFPNQNTKLLTHDQQNENVKVAPPLATNLTTAGSGSGSYIKAILTKHKLSHTTKIPSETAASLAMAALNLTNTAKITLRTVNDNPATNFNNSSYNSLLPNLNTGTSNTTSVVNAGISNNNNNNNIAKPILLTAKISTTTTTTQPTQTTQSKSASFHKSLMPKYSSSTLFKLNNLKSHFKFNKNY
jgi:hypothetical protein